MAQLIEFLGWSASPELRERVAELASFEWMKAHRGQIHKVHGGRATQLGAAWVYSPRPRGRPQG